MWITVWLRRRAGLIGLLALFTFGLCAMAQISTPSIPGMPGEDSDLQRLFGRFPSPEMPQGMYFEGPIDPNQYVVGPGDRLRLNFWQPRYAEYTVTVNSEGDVAIPLVGLVDLANATLAEARFRIEDAVARAIRVSRITVSLVEPRQFRVHVTGLVRRPGTYIVPATARVADAILMAGGLKHDIQVIGGDTVLTALSSRRRVILRDPAGNTRHADLLSFMHGGRSNANPYLRDGETVYVPHAEQTSSQIGVSGGVYAGGLFEYLEGDRLADVLALSGGLRPTADSSSLLIVGSGGTETRIDLRPDPEAAMARPLRPGDRVYVGAFPDTSRNGSVTVVGEVARPGGYAIREGETTVREILYRAGGPLPTAASNFARLISSVEQDPIAQERNRILQQAMTNRESPYPADPGLAAEFTRWSYSATVIDLADAMREGSEAGSRTLRDGDSLQVLKGPIGVRVLGAVNRAGEVEWKPDANLSYYVKKAGGLNRAGSRSQTVVLKARNGSHLRYESGLPIEPGDVVFIPLKSREQTSWEIFKDVIAVTAQVATVLAVVISLGN